MDEDEDGWGDGWGDFEEVDFSAEAEPEPAKPAEPAEPTAPAEPEPAKHPVGWGSLVNFGQALLQEASSALAEPEETKPEGEKDMEELSAMLESYQRRLEEIYRKHNPEKVADIEKLIGRYRDQAEKVEDTAAFHSHCEEKLKSFYEAVCKKYSIEE
ncbi:unnamed protein product, partial [Effrenium voratum]